MLTFILSPICLLYLTRSSVLSWYHCACKAMSYAKSTSSSDWLLECIGYSYTACLVVIFISLHYTCIYVATRPAIDILANALVWLTWLFVRAYFFFYFASFFDEFPCLWCGPFFLFNPNIFFTVSNTVVLNWVNCSKSGCCVFFNL